VKNEKLITSIGHDTVLDQLQNGGKVEGRKYIFRLLQFGIFYSKLIFDK